MSPFDRLDAGARAEARRLAARLAHDVGKYVAMTARNLPRDGPVPERLVAMLARDLFALEGTLRASEVFERLAAPLERLVADPRLARARADLATLDALERAVRAAEPAAVTRAAGLARAVEEALRELSRDLAAK